MSFFKPYRSVYDKLASYWAVYGGLKAVIASPYAHMSLIITIITWPSWHKSGLPDNPSVGWWDAPLSILPNMLGFTLGGVAILTAWGDSSFISALRRKPKSGRPSPFSQILSTFVHFLLVQVSALLYAILAKSRPISGILTIVNIESFSKNSLTIFLRKYLGELFWFVGNFLFIYSITLAAAAVLGIFWFASWSEKAEQRKATTASADSKDG